jgi:hypothetical protein
MDGVVKPEEFDYFRMLLTFHELEDTDGGFEDEMIITQELVRSGARGYGDGMVANSYQ